MPGTLEACRYLENKDIAIDAIKKRYQAWVEDE